MAWDKDTGAGPLLDIFKGFLLLVVTDANLVQPPAYGSGKAINPEGYGKAREAWDEDRTIYPPRVIATTWGLHTGFALTQQCFPWHTAALNALPTGKPENIGGLTPKPQRTYSASQI